MNLSSYSSMELLKVYGDVLSEMRHRNMIRSKNVTGDLGEYIVVDYYTKTKGLPKLQFAPPSTKNIDAISVAGERYSIKSTTGHVTGVFYGIEKDIEKEKQKQLFEYVVVVKLDDLYQPELILELDWDAFFEHKNWHSRVGAYNLQITKSLIDAGKVIYSKE